MAARRPRFAPKLTTSAPPVRAASTVPSVEPSSITSTSASGSSPCSSANTAGRFSASFQAGMKTTVSATRRGYRRHQGPSGLPARVSVATGIPIPPRTGKGDGGSTTSTPGITAKSDAIYELVAEGSAVERLATGFTFTEGPIWHPDGYLLFSDMPGDVRRKYTPGSGVIEVMRPAFKCNGMTYDAELRLIVCEHV